MKKKLWLIIGVALVCVALIVLAVEYFSVTLPKQQEREEHRRQVQAYRAEKMERFRRENAQYDDYAVDVAFLGDSLTDLYELEKYYPQYVTSNRGIGGDTSFDLEGRMQESVYDLKPKVVVLLIGANNPESVLDNYEDILVGLKENLPETNVVVLSMTAMGGEIWGSRNQQAAYNNVSIRLLAEKYGYTFVDLYAPLYDVSIGEVYEGYTVDGGHFTDLGYRVITDIITPVLEQLLGK